MSDHIPLEVQEEILKRLPVKPLIQFRSVSKSWKSLIDSPEFAGAYGVRQTHPSRLILRYNHIIDVDVEGDIVSEEERYLAFVDNDNDYTFTRQDFAPIMQKLVTPPYLVGSSHGLLCFNDFDGGHISMVVLWNPSISKSIGIQVPNFHHLSNPWRYEVIGFGVCPVTFDPTILGITLGNGVPWKVEVFTLSTGTWSLLSTNLPRESIGGLDDWSQVVIDRFIYWVAVDSLLSDDLDRSPFLIVSFDLTAKEFKEINLTGSLTTNQLYCIQAISKLRESLVLLAHHMEFEKNLSVFCVWMMKEQGVSKSFTKLYTINLHAMVHSLLGCRKTGDLILETQRQYGQNHRIEIYEPSSEAVDDLGIDGEDYSFFMCYMETLLLHDHPDGFIYSIRN